MRRLKKLDVNEISLVKRAANKRRYLITKTAGDEMATSVEDIMSDLAGVPLAVQTRLQAIAKSSFQKADGEGGLTPRQQDALTAVGRILSPHIDDIPADAITQMLEAIGRDGVDGIPGDDDDEDPEEPDSETEPDDVEPAVATADAATLAPQPTQKADTASEDDEMQKSDKPSFEECKKAATEKSKATYAATMKAFGFGDDEDDAGEDKEDDKKEEADKSGVAKSADVDLSALSYEERLKVESIFKSHADLEEVMAVREREAIQKTAELQAEILQNEMISKAAELPHLGSKESLALMLLRQSQRDPEGFEAQMGVYKSWNAAMDKSELFQERGTALGAKDGAADAESQIMAAVQSRVAKSDGGLSEAQAYTQFITKTAEGKALYKSYVEELAAKRSAT